MLLESRALRSQIDLHKQNYSRSEKLLVVYMESCFRSLATQSSLPGQHFASLASLGSAFIIVAASCV